MTQRFGAYEILYELKSGGMGSVLLARRRGPGAFEQLVAIKTIRREHANTPAVRAMFLDEAAILARLNHPGIATVHDFGEEAGTLYMVMEYVQGIAFRDVLELNPPPTIVARAIAEACRGLHAAHEVHDSAGNPLGLVHRDISPDNLMLGFDGHVKVIDFGIALIKNRQAPVTEFGLLKGKPPYMSPEQVKSEPMDRRSDVFSLGIVAWEMLTHKHLFDGDSLYAIAYAVQEADIQPPSRAIGEPLPLGLDAAVMNALARDLAQRTPTAAELAEQLEEVVQSAGGETLEAWAERTLRQKRDEHRAWLAGIVGGTTPLPRAAGRATGQVTELAPIGLAATGIAPAPLPEKTSIGGTQAEIELLPRRRLVAPLVIVLLVLLGGGIAAYLLLHAHGDAPIVRDAASVTIADARAVVPVTVADAAPPAPDAPPPPIDAGVPLDAGHTRTVVVHVPHDAAVVAPRPDAPAGTGTVKIFGKTQPFTNISIDGSAGVPGPLITRKLPAGHHVIKFLDPTSGDAVDSQSVDLTDGEVKEIRQK